MSAREGTRASSTALVTGATGGLGEATAARLYALGHRVVLAGRSAKRLRALRDRLGESARVQVLDIADPSSVADAEPVLADVDILINNAGVLFTQDSDPTTVELDLVERELGINLMGTWRVTQSVLPGMLHRRHGRIVNISSGAASFHWGLHAQAPGYTLSKVAVNALTVCLANRTRDSGVLVNAINPGQIRTSMMPYATRAADDAAEDVCWAAMLPDGGPTGRFFRRPNEEMQW